MQKENEKIRIKLKDCIRHKNYNWPLTMLSCPLIFKSPVEEKDWELKNEKGDSLPFQVTDMQREGQLVKGLTLHFLASLAAGEEKEYFFGYREEGTDAIWENVPGFSFHWQINEEQSSFTVTYGKQKMTCSLPFDSVEYETVYSGCIFEEAVIVCAGTCGREYILHIRRIAGMPFWELKEEMNGFQEEEPEQMYLVFEGFDFTHRHSWERPVEKIDAYLKEGDMLPVVVMPYENWVPWYQSKYIGFLGKEYSAGIFIRDNLEWDDGKYPVWGSDRKFGITFQYEEDRMKAYFPLKNGKRFVGVAVWEGQEADYAEKLWQWYAWLHLDKVRKWVLEWEENKGQYPRFFRKDLGKPLTARGVLYQSGKPLTASGSLYRKGETLTGSKMTDVIDTISPSMNDSCSPVNNREFAEWTAIVDLTADEMTEEEFDRAKAAFAFMAYACMDENYMPTENMLAGHPNFLADTSAVPGFAAALFPGHPEKERFRQYFNRAVSLNMKYHIRPDVEAYGSLGGRATENLACYTFAMLRPFSHVCRLFELCGYPNPLVCENGAKWLNWLNNCMSAPVEGRRRKPPQGAHARNAEIPYILYELAQFLEKDYPQIAQNTYAICEGNPLSSFEYSSIEEDIWRNLFVRGEEKGKLALKSEKFTGFGCILREAAGTPDEISVHVQQLDKGPNYRWGCFENTGNGGIHYYAANRRWSFNAPEDTGDDNVGAEQGNCGFSVLKGHTYHNIGFRDLTEPLRDFPVIKQIKLLAGEEIADFYKYRRVSLVEKDYVVLYDAVTHMRARGRFLWTVNEMEAFPAIWQLVPGVEGRACKTEPVCVLDERDSLPMEKRSRSVAYDGHGNFLTIVSHRRDIRAKATEYGAVVYLPDRTDYVFEEEATIRYQGEQLSFTGHSGVLSVHSGGKVRGALLEGREICCPGLDISLRGKGAAFFEGSAGKWKGSVAADEACTLEINGKRSILERGKYNWELQNDLHLVKLPDRKYSGNNGFVRDTGKHEFGFDGTDFDAPREILHYPQR